MERKIEVLKVSQVIPYHNNPRRNDAAVDAVAASIRKFGFQSPILIDENGVILAGHTRFAAAKKLNMDAVPCLIARGLNEAQKMAFRIADNKTAELAVWDFSKLDAELKKIDFAEILRGAENLDFSDFGESVADIDAAGMEAFGFKKHELEAIDADGDISALLQAFDITSPQKVREAERAGQQPAAPAVSDGEKAEKATDNDRVKFTAEGRREDFGADFWDVAGLLYSRGVKVTID